MKTIGIIGGGIVGATTAFYLQKAGLSVVLYDDGTGQATSAAAGIISPWLSQRRNQNWYQLACLGAKLYPSLIQELKLEQKIADNIYRQNGTLLFKKTPALLDKLQQIALKRRENAPEIGEIKRVSPAEVKQLFPLVETSDEALFISGGARVDGAALVQALLQAFQALGGQVIKEKVTKLNSMDQAWQVTTQTDTQAHAKLILAVGAWLPELLASLDLKVDIRGQKGQLVALKANIETKNWPVIMPQGEGDIIPFDHGKILVGATHENEKGYDLKPEQEKIKDLLAHTATLTPQLARYPITETRVGTRAYTSDFLPFFGAIESFNELYVASGLGSSGLTTGPAIAYLLTQIILGEKSLTEIAAYSPMPYLQNV